jgi:hypothetical protein
MDKPNANDPQANPGAANQTTQKVVIDANDSSRNDERDQRIREEQGTERLRSERESTRIGEQK